MIFLLCSCTTQKPNSTTQPQVIDLTKHANTLSILKEPKTSLKPAKKKPTPPPSISPATLDSSYHPEPEVKQKPYKNGHKNFINEMTYRQHKIRIKEF